MLISLVFIAVMLNQPNEVSKMKMSEAIDLFKENKVEYYELNLGNGNLEIDLKGVEENTVYRVPSINYFVEKIDPYVEQNNVPHDFIPATTFPAWLQVIPYVILLGFLGFMLFNMSQANGGGKGMAFAKARTKDAGDLSERKYFKDVAGADEEKEELVEIVEFLKDPGKFNALGAKIPKGVLLVGPPGTGKTLLAKATAGEAGVPFFSISGSDFVEMYVGVGASRVRDLFDKAKKAAPSIIFIDEIDAVGRQRGAGLGGGHDEREQTLNQMLVEMDGFGANTGVIVMAATNRADILDRALLRPGRFDRQVYVGHPDIKGRQEILAVHLRNKPVAPDVDTKAIAQATAGFTGADLENLCNEAALMAAKKGKKAITKADMDAAVIKVIAGPEKKSKVVTEKEKKLVSYHEAGHAVATYVCETSSPVKEISIVPRGMAGGYTLSIPEEDTNYRTKKEMLDEIVTLLGGRCAEKLILEVISTGASNDLERTTAIAKSMVMRYGFSDRLGNVVYGHDPQQTFLGRDYGQGQGYSDAVANEIDSEIRRLVDEGYNRCMQILQDNIEKLHIVAKILMKKEKIDGDEFAKIMADDYVYVEETEEPAVEPIVEETTEETPVVENAEAVAEIVETANEEIAETVETVVEPIVEETTEEPKENE
ncbi:MAG: ATP-dependent zinc metalloprotease FtsH [Oscillospiraceae bacterium]|nr:ATP-dependent zinc metalloprotease FtsH [Oscillospiraceae bacterium]